MLWQRDTLTIPTRGKGLYPISRVINASLKKLGVKAGMCFIYMPHTSASLVINESYDPSAQEDMAAYLERIAPENQPWHTHTTEGADDSSAHLRAMLLPVSLTVPVENGELAMGTWQGVYLVEHRTAPHTRKVVLRCLAVD